MAAHDVSPDDGSLGALFETSPDRPVHTSAAAEAAFVLGLVGLVSVPFSLMHGLSLAVGVLGAVLGLVGVATTSRPSVAGRALAPLGLLASLVVLTLVGLRYLGMDTAFGDTMVPGILDVLRDLNESLPRP